LRKSKALFIADKYHWRTRLFSSDWHRQTGKKIIMKEELIEVAGLIIDKQRDASFKVQVNGTDHIVMAQISGRMRRNKIRILIGDRVDVEMSPYDLTKGRITYRHK
jgi:translation initiation factor IF-1